VLFEVTGGIFKKKYFLIIKTINMKLQKATRKKVKLRLGISAVAGGGKTFSALKLAKGLVGNWSKIVVIDTENGSASLYSNLGEFNTIELNAPYSPERYIEAIKACENAGMECIIIDSITHEWDGEGGIINISNSMTGNSFTNWAKLTPRHDAFINAILQSKCHIITTVRRKQDYEVTKDNSGKLKVEKAGLKEITREGFEYELTVNFNLDEKHNCTASKDRTSLFMDKPQFIITEDTGKLILDWCELGIDDHSGKIELTDKHEKWNGAVKALADNATTIEKVEKVYFINAENREKLITAAIEYDVATTHPDGKHAPQRSPNGSVIDGNKTDF